jgi:hypothetical protein
MNKELEKKVAEMFPTAESIWFDSGKISERASIITKLEATCDHGDPEWDSFIADVVAIIAEKS